MAIKNVIIIGPAWPLRGGGITTFNERLCRQFLQEGMDCCIYSFSLQYPSFLFPGKTQYSDEPAPADLEIYSVINSVHPLNWWQVGNEIKRIKPDIVVVRFWLPFMGPSLGTILRRVQKNRHTRIIAITDNVIPHEKRPGDQAFTRYFLNSCDAFITMSEKVMHDLRRFESTKPARQALHPLYDNFGEPVSKEEAREKLNISHNDNLLLFFGFIRKYKGLDMLLEAMQLLQQEGAGNGLKLLIAGEFYEDPKWYQQRIDELGIRDRLILRTGFIPANEVKYYMCAADCVVQPYRSATQSGVTPLAYHFQKPMVVTNVGGLPDMVPHNKAGMVCEPEPRAIADAIRAYFQLGENYFIPHLRAEKEKYSWHQLVQHVLELAGSIKK